MVFTLAPLPFALNSLAPLLSQTTLELHYGKHHQGYVDQLNRLIEGRPEAELTLEELILQSDEGPILNNAAQHWNHTFYWASMLPLPAPGVTRDPEGDLFTAINVDFGSLIALREEFRSAAAAVFGSGWVWLVRRADGKLAVTHTSNADLPLRQGQTALLCCDVWEHAYYVDYQNVRAKYVDQFWKLINWRFAEQNFGQGAKSVRSA